MIARTWHGRVPAAKADAYYEYLLRTGLTDYRATPGNLGVLVQRHVEGDVAHFVLTTLWDSVESIRRFAGADHRQARYYPADDEYLLEREPFVHHADVLLAAFAEPTVTACESSTSPSGPKTSTGSAPSTKLTSAAVPGRGT